MIWMTTAKGPTNPSYISARRSVIAALIGISAVAVILRYPETHEEGVDSFLIHGLAGAISATGRVGWLITPLSYFGFAPLSYAPAVPITLASFSDVAGLSLEPTVLVYSLLLGALTPWTAFLLGRTASRHDGVSLFFAFLVTSSEGMVGFTTWTVSARGAFLVVTPLALAFFISLLTRPNSFRTHFSALALVSITLVFIHALWVLLLPSMVAVWLVYRLATMEDSILRHRFTLAKRSRVTLLSLAMSGVLLFVVMELGPGQSRLLTGVPQILGGLPGDNAVIAVGLQYATIIGLGIILFPIGLWGIVRAIDSKRRYVLIGLSMVFLPSSLDPVYGILLAIPVLLLIAGIALAPSRLVTSHSSTKARSGSMLAAVVVGVLVIAVPPLVTVPRSSGIPCQGQWSLDGQTYNAALYIRQNQPPDSTFVWDDGVEADRIQAISGVPAEEPLEGMGTLAYPWLAHKMTPQFALDPDILGSLAGNHQVLTAREWLPLTGASYDYYWGKHTFVLLQSYPSSPTASEILQFYQSRYAIEGCPGSGGVFFSGLQQSSFVVYTDELQRTYAL